MLFFATFGAFSLGYYKSGRAQNYYTLGAGEGVAQMSDYSTEVMLGVMQQNSPIYN